MADKDLDELAEYLHEVKRVRLAGGGNGSPYTEWLTALEQLRHAVPLQGHSMEQHPLDYIAEEYCVQGDKVGVSTVQADDAQTPPLATHAAGATRAARLRDPSFVRSRIEILRSRDLEIPEFHAMQLHLADALEGLLDELARLREGKDA